MSSDSLRILTREARAAFRQCFGGTPTVLCAAPGRINILGEHTDYNHGYVLPMAVNRWCVMAAEATEEPWVEIVSRQREISARIPLDQPIARTTAEPDAPWANALRGVLAGFLERGTHLPGLRVMLHSDVPPGAGLASSAAIAVAFATVLETVSHLPLDPLDLVLLCQKAEQEFAGVPCGVMDQYISRLGREGCAVLIDCESLTHRHVPLRDDRFQFLTVDSGVHYQVVSSAYHQRREECESAAALLGLRKLRQAQDSHLTTASLLAQPTLLARARHVLSENARTLTAARRLAAGDWQALGTLLNEGHRSLTEDFQLSCPEVETLIRLRQEIPLAASILGARLTGAGFGGSVIYLVETAHTQAVAEQLLEAYAREHPQAAEASTGWIASHPGQGAVVLSGD